jgi:SsrA-binding protein
MASPEKSGKNVVAKNRRAQFDYELGDRFEAGLVLIGSEVRSLRDKGADITAAWVDIDWRGEAWVKDMKIPKLEHAAFGHEEKRTRKLMLHQKEIARLQGTVAREGLTLIATLIYFKGGRAKLEFALAKGRKHHDKRHAIRDRQLEREARQAMRRGRS